ncbi:hypothetical protein NEMBOFW57_002783 [Staphylotrichum longicolle]|uniref:Methyltransferase n=1 Tax=Staphylotrichum longicolle TaxID=669026 RepID=A0AAD4I529_9PEZI|nr:hypothetical protein NEMBOFW57_002783 [Staphylotrichum longicolle]
MGHDLATTINYYNDPGDGSPPTPVYVGSTQVTNERPTIPLTHIITDISEQTDGFTLDSHGFQYLNHASSVDQLLDEHKIRNNYYPECEKLLKHVTGAIRVIRFGHQVRRGPAHWHSISQHNTNSRGPLHRAHVDQSYDGAVIRLREQFPDPGEASREMTRRWQIINVWRPISTVLTSPLALADATTVPDADLVPASIIHTSTGRRQESWTARPNPAHRWYYKYRRRPDEVVLIKCFDSDETAAARRAVHCAVEDPDTQGQGNRESVEVRCLVFY